MRTTRVAGILILITTIGPPARARAEVTAEQVHTSIDDAVSFLRKAAKADGTWNGSWAGAAAYPGADTSLAILALLTAGVPVDDPQIQSALTALRRIEPEKNYTAAVQTMVFCLAEPQKDLLLIRRNVTFMENHQLRNDRSSNGAWNYSKQGGGDNSNTQFVMLALHEAERVGVSTSEATWRLAKDYWTRTQNPDGSWGYTPGAMGSGSMTCAGIAAMIMAAEKLDDGDARVDGAQVECCGPREPNTPVERGLGWLSRNFSVHQNPNNPGHLLYYLYAMERVGRLTNSRLIGKHDWYREGVEALIRRQTQLKGSWKGVGLGENEELIGTCLALLFVAKGRRPVLAAKLSFEPEDHWERHRKDLAHLTDYCGKQWRRELTWQVIRASGATADDYNQAPVLYISGSEKPTFTDTEVKELRKYLDLGGFIFAENCCADRKGTEFDVAFRALMQRLFPERDAGGRSLHELRLLPPEHSVWSAEEPIDPQYLKPLWGLDVGCRTSVIYCPTNLGCYWELDRLGRKDAYAPAVEAEIRAVRSIGINVMAYATNREVKFKLEIPHIAVDEGPADSVDRAMLHVAEVKHSGGSAIAPTALVNLLKQLRQESGLRVGVEKRELALTQDTLFDHHLVFMHGRNSFTFSDVERKQLRLFIERGGMLLADSVCSSAEFTASFRREMQTIFPETPLKPVPAAHAMFGEKFGGFNLSRVTLRDPRRSGAGGPLQTEQMQVPPELEGIELGKRWGVIFSRYDLSCALERQNSLECAGYGRDDAAKIGINILLFSLRGNL